MSKRIISMILVFVLVLSLVACGDNTKTVSSIREFTNSETVDPSDKSDSSDIVSSENNASDDGSSKNEEITSSDNSPVNDEPEADEDEFDEDDKKDEETASKPSVDAVKDEMKKGKYKYVWGDEFNGKTLDLKTWMFSEGAATGDMVYSRDKQFVNVTNGHLKLVMDKYFDPSNKDIRYARPVIVTSDKGMNFKYGYLEMRAKVPYQRTAWPAFWLMDGSMAPSRENKRYHVEVDIFEIFSSAHTATTTVYKHYINGAGSTSVVPGEYTFDDFADLSNEYHLYGFEWTPEKMIFWIDGKVYTEFDITEKNNFDSDGFTTDMRGFHDYLHIKLSMSGFTPQSSWQVEGSVANSNTKFPFNYDIDWIRLYQDPSVKESGLVLAK